DLFRWNTDCVRLTVWCDGQLDEISLTRLFFVGNVTGQRVVLVGSAKASMKLIDCFDLRNAFQRCKAMRFAALARAIIDDRNARLERAHQDWIIAGVRSVMIDLENVDSTDNRSRTC